MGFEVARAKINLSLDVLGKRADGYHEVEMVMQTVDLCDYLTFSPRRDSEIVLRATVPFIPSDERNLAWQAAAALRRVARRPVPGATIHLDKRIPVAAGLGGGSSDAAAALRGLNKMWELGLTLDELADIGATVGSDVPFLVYGGTAIARGRGERIEHLDVVPAFWVVLVKPSHAVSTAEVYSAFDPAAVEVRPDTASMVEALRSGQVSRIAGCVGNVLETVTSRRYPEIGRIKEQMQKLGAAFSMMSGSGPTVFGAIERQPRAKRIYNELRQLFNEVYLCRTC